MTLQPFVETVSAEGIFNLQPADFLHGVQATLSKTLVSHCFVLVVKNKMEGNKIK